MNLRRVRREPTGIADRPARAVELVTWRDAYDGPASWTPPRDVDGDPTLVRSVGFVIEPSPIRDHMLLVTSTVLDGDEEHVSGGIVIPRCLVVSRRKLG